MAKRGMGPLFLAVLLIGAALAGCQSEPKIDAASGAYGKASEETQLPPQGKPPAPGEDVGARAKQAAGVK